MGLFGPGFSQEKRNKVEKTIITTVRDEEVKSCLTKSMVATFLLSAGSFYGVYNMTKGNIIM